MMAITGARQKLPCMLAQMADARAIRVRWATVVRWGILSQNKTVASRNNQLKTWGRASQWRLVVESRGEAKRQARKKFPPVTQLSLNHIQTPAPMARA